MFCFLTGNCTPPSAHHFACALRQKQSAECRSLHRLTRRWDSGGELKQISFKCYARATQSHFVSSHFEEVCSPSKIFLDLTNAYEAQNKMASRSHDCPQWAEADPQPGSQEGKQEGRVSLVEGGKKSHCYAKEWVWPGGRHCCAQLLICPASEHKWPFVNHLPADRLSHDIPRAQASQRPSRRQLP